MQYYETTEDRYLERLESMSRDELLEELQDILAQSRMQCEETIYSLLGQGRFSFVETMLENETLTEPESVEIIFDLLKQNQNHGRQALESHLYC